MRRTSFAGALTAIAGGGALLFGIQNSPRTLDVHAAGLIIMLAGAADLLLRFMIADSPLLSPTAADVAAVEPSDDVVLDVFGNPITTADPGLRTPLVVPASETTQVMPAVVEPPPAVVPHELAYPVAERPETAVHDHALSDQVVRQVGDYGADESLVPISPLTGRPVGTRRRRGRLR